ncbi:DUF4242 domain-containing protein [Magnetovibrio sp.]|uniref:DUF4242 domain-containing protein n=1 Tax=Magnetovibrio sp. TaxID=2024836 RepID=UPI002F93A4AA
MDTDLAHPGALPCGSPLTVREDHPMNTMRFFVDTHDTQNGTFPESLNEEQFEQFFAQYKVACQEEGVVLLQVNVGLEDGRAFCMTMAPNAEAVRRSHERVGLPYASITEVKTATPGTIFFKPQAA